MAGVIMRNRYKNRARLYGVHIANCWDQPLTYWQSNAILFIGVIFNQDLYKS